METVLALLGMERLEDLAYAFTEEEMASGTALDIFSSAIGKVPTPELEDEFLELVRRAKRASGRENTRLANLDATWVRLVAEKRQREKTDEEGRGKTRRIELPGVPPRPARTRRGTSRTRDSAAAQNPAEVEEAERAKWLQRLFHYWTTLKRRASRR